MADYVIRFDFSGLFNNTSFLLLRWNPSECRREDYKSIFQNYSSLHVAAHLNDRTDIALEKS